MRAAVLAIELSRMLGPEAGKEGAAVRGVRTGMFGSHLCHETLSAFFYIYLSASAKSASSSNCFFG